MRQKRKIRYAVVGLGYISQIAVLPAFANAKRNSELAALISDDPVKLKELGKKYRVDSLYSYEDYEACLDSGEIDAVYVALPNSMHEEYTLRAAKMGIHVLCEKPLASSVEACERMIEGCDENKVLLMTAYRLHFEKANLKAIEIANSGKLGDLRAFNSLFTMQVKAGNTRLQKELGGGTVWDLGIYCINAARNLFRAEPMEVTAISANNGDRRFKDIDEMTGGIMRFPGERLATFLSSFGSADASSYEILGTKGSLRVDPAYEMVDELAHTVKRDGRQQKSKFAKRDQFAPELLYFSDCVLDKRRPEPSGEEGLADVRVIDALYRSAQSCKTIALQPFDKEPRPRLKQEEHRPAVSRPELIHAQAPSR